MFSIEKQVDISASRQVVAVFDHSARMTLAERGGRAIMRVLSKDARVVSVSAVQTGGDVDVLGKVVCTAVCEISGGEVVCLEYLGGFAFSRKLAGVPAGSACDVSALVSGVRVVRASGCEVALEVDFAVRGNFAVMCGENSILSAGGCYCEVEKFQSQSAVLKIHNFTAVAEMEVGASIATVISREFCVETTAVSASSGSCVVSGNVHGLVSFLDSNGAICSEACVFPFREQFSCGEFDGVSAFPRVREHNIVCEVNEVRGSSVVTCEVEVEISLWGFVKAECEKGGNFFSDKVEIIPETAEFCFSELDSFSTASGKFSQAVEIAYELPERVFVAGSRIAKISRRGESCVFDCEILCTLVGSDLKFSEVAVMAEIAFPASGEGKTDVCDVYVCEIDARISAGKVEVFGSVCGNLMLCTKRCETVVSSLACGAEKACGGGGFVLYRAENGESLLDVATAVGVMPDVLKKQNPDVVFPIAGMRKVVVWK